MNKQKILQEKGLKTTSARIAVLDHLEKQKNPIDVLTIVESLNSQADQATIYRILEVLTQKGIVNRLEFGEGKYRYEIEKEHHHHLVCTNCGKIEDIEIDLSDDFDREVFKKKGFKVESHSLEFFGLCRSCQN